MHDARYPADLPRRSAERTRLRKQSFDHIPALYDRYRPTYPAPLFDALSRLARLPPRGRVLEIGPGTGQATLPLARRGYRILGLELGPNTCRHCRGKLRDLPNVTILNTAFEEWKLEPYAFDLVLAAAAFHWIPARIAFPRCAAALKPTGSLALLWNFRETPDAPAFAELREAYRHHIPQRARLRAPQERVERQRKKIVGSGRFGPVTVVTHPWRREYTATEYIGLMRTMSDHAILAPEARRRLFRSIRAIIARHGGKLILPYVAVLFHAPLRRP